MKNKNIFDAKLDSEEQDLLDSVERGEWKTVENAMEEATFAKKAAYKGLSYQTFIASILHEYAAGHFIEVGA